MIQVKNLTKRYDAAEVVSHVSLAIEPGKITSFIGPNGAGKSTLLSMIARLTQTSGGGVLIEGRPLNQWNNRELARKIAILKQTNHLNVRLSVRELIAFGRFPHNQGRSTPDDERMIDQAIAYLKLEDMQHRLIHELSGGQKQRAYIAMVLAQDTEYILLDEPLNNLDMKNAVEIMKILRRIVDELGKTVVLVIHDINFAACYSDRIVALADGKVLYDDETDAIINESILTELFDMPFEVHAIAGQKICTYYSENGSICPIPTAV